jgi:hypothetical protein
MRRFFLIGLLALAACASGAQTSPRSFAGTWAFHFETSAFVTDAGEGPYWLAGDDVWPQLTAPFSTTGNPWGEAHVVVEGELSAPGQYGHLGAYERELRVTRVIESRLISSRR